MAGSTQSSRPDNAFVGRDQELKQLKAAFERAAAGSGSLVMLAGEPGIGKTALCRQVAAYAAERGGCVLLGHCYEEIALPYLAFVEAVHDLLLENAAILDGLGGAEYLARLVPDLRNQLQVESSPPGDPEREQWWLLEAAAGCLRRVAEQAPLLLVVEDLHWADRGTLQLLLHCVRRLKDARVLILGTYRDVELDKAHPLAGALADLLREADLQPITLRGLAADEVHGLCEALLGARAAPEHTAAVYDQTEGNPLFVREVVRYQPSDGASAGDGVPESLRAMLSSRLGHLSDSCGTLLLTAAVLGREFQLDVLKRVGSLADDVLVAALEEATGAGVIEEVVRPGTIRYRFTHALFRQTVYDHASAARRLNLHRQAGLALEELYAGRIEHHAVELAGHFGNCTDKADLSKAVEYARTAARQAMEVFAFSEAVRLLERAVEQHTATDPSDKERLCDLVLAEGDALSAAGERDRIIDDVAPRALALAEELGDQGRALAACRLLFDVTIYSDRQPTQAWLDAAERYAGSDPRLRISVNIPRAAHAVHAGQWDAARGLMFEAIDVARHAGLPLLQAEATSFLLRIGLATDAEERSLFNEIRNLHFEKGSIRSEAAAHFDAVMTFLQWGQRREAENEHDALVELEARTRHSLATAHLAQADTLFAMLDGRLQEAVELGNPTSRIGSFPLIWRGHLAAWLGDQERLEELLGSSRRLRTPTSQPAFSAFFLAHLGRAEEARREVLATARANLHGPDGKSASQVYLSLLASHCSLNEDSSIADAILERLRDDTRLLAKPCLILVPRHLGRAAGLVGRFDEARAHFETAIAFCERIRYRPELALSQLDLADLLVQRFPGEHDAAAALIDRAAGELEAMGMQPALARAQDLRERIQVAASPSRKHHPMGLSDRQVEVLRLAATGKSNQEIADELVLSVRTVERHISDSYSKIGVRNRVEAAAFARAHLSDTAE